MLDKDKEKNKNAGAVELDDDVLEQAAGGLKRYPRDKDPSENIFYNYGNRQAKGWMYINEK